MQTSNSLKNPWVPFHTFQKSVGSMEPTEPTLTTPLLVIFLSDCPGKLKYLLTGLLHDFYPKQLISSKLL